jgi:hypothetical protein
VATSARQLQPTPPRLACRAIGTQFVDDVIDSGCHGPGGGGGGGRVLLAADAIRCSAVVTGGSAGLCSGQDHGAAPGSVGVVRTMEPRF